MKYIIKRPEKNYYWGNGFDTTVSGGWVETEQEATIFHNKVDALNVLGKLNQRRNGASIQEYTGGRLSVRDLRDRYDRAMKGV